MSKKATLYMDKDKNKTKQRNRVIAVIILCLAAVSAVIAYYYLKPSPYNVTLNDGGDLVIPIDQLNEDVSYIKHKALPQDLIVMLSDSGSAKVAFDTCEECYSSGNAHYSYSDGILVCGNCYNSYDAKTLGEASWGGCQPVAVPPVFRADTDTEIVIPAEVLHFAANMFSGWDAGNYDLGFDDFFSE